MLVAIKFQTAGDRDLIVLRAQCHKAFAIFFVLRGNQGDTAQERTDKLAKLRITRGGAGGKPRISDNQGNMTFVQRSNQIWPELSLHDQYQLRINLIEETIERIGQIIRQVNVLNIVAKGGLDALRAGLGWPPEFRPPRRNAA